MSVLFADLVRFIVLVERLTPSLMVTVLNRRFGQWALAIHPNDGPARVMLDRTIRLRLSPPGEHWNGIHVMTEK